MERNSATQLKTQRKQISEMATDLRGDAVAEVSGALRKLLADVFALYVKPNNFHWPMSGRHFRDCHLLLDEHGDQIFAMTDDIRDRRIPNEGTYDQSLESRSA